MGAEDFFTWVQIDRDHIRFWVHGNGKARIDEDGELYVISYRRLGPDGYYWDKLYVEQTLGRAKALAETAFVKTKKRAA